MSATGRLRRLAPNLTLVAIGAIASLLVLEIGVRLFVDPQEHAPIAVHDVDPARPIAFLPNRQRVYETSEFRYTVSFNRFGRRDVEWTPQTIADPRNLLMIGDSFVLGSGVDHPDAIPTRLEAELAARGEVREVFNFGMPVGAPPTYLELLRDALDSGFAAETILVGLFVGNDFYDYLLPGRQRSTAPAAEPAPRLRWLPRSELARFVRLRVSQSPRLVGLALGLSGMFGISLYDTAGSYVFLRRPTAEQEAVFDAMLGYVGRMQELAEARGRRLLAVIFPNKIQVENQEELTGAVFDAARPNQRILAFCAERGLACIDLLPALRAAWTHRGEPLFYPIDRHMNATGYRIAAEVVGEFLGTWAEPARPSAGPPRPD